MDEASITDVNLAFAKKSFQVFLRNKTVDSRGCFIPNKKPRSDGYVRFSVTAGSTMNAFGPFAPKKERTFYVHHLAWYVAGNSMPKPRLEHLSHLCSNPACCNVNHLVVETPEANNSRKNCGFEVSCPCCKHTFAPCDHDPKCVPRKRKTLSTPEPERVTRLKRTLSEGVDSADDFESS